MPMTANSGPSAMISRSQVVQQSQHHQNYVDANVKKSVNSKPVKIHDSWSSRASSILKDPQSIYVSREEVLANLKADILRAAPPPKG